MRNKPYLPFKRRRTDRIIKKPAYTGFFNLRSMRAIKKI